MKKKVIIIGIIIILAFLIIYFEKPKKVEELPQVAPPKEEVYHNVQYFVKVNNITIMGNIKCKECYVKDVILAISRDLTKRGFETLPVYNESLICFLRKCGRWKILFNGSEVKMSDKIGEGKVEIIWEGK